MAKKNSALNQRAAQEMQMLKVQADYDEQQKNTPKPIGTDEIRKATEILRKYKEGKANLEKKIISNEQFWKLRQWNSNYQPGDDFKPATAWLWSCIQSRHSDAMDSYPTCNFKPRQQDDKAEAKMLSDIIPVVLEQNRYEETYSDFAWYMLKHGGACQGIFWDTSKHNGLGDISVRNIDFLNMFWESGITDIQESENVFTTELVSNKILMQRYPQTEGHLCGKNVTVAKYLYDDSVDTNDKSVVVDWYYHKWENGKKALHYVKYVEDVVLYATENDTEIPTRDEVDPETNIPVKIPLRKPIAETGLYNHAMYPFVVQQLFPIAGSLCGYGLTDIGKDAQMQIDVINKAITENSVVNSAPRYFTKGDGNVNEEEFLDMNKPLVHVQGNLADAVMPIESNLLSGTYLEVLNQKIEELKYVTANQDVNNGGAPSGITAASAVAALQETAGKNARDANKSFHRAFKDVCYQIVELIRQFYDTPRTFRIAPDNLPEMFVQFSNEGLVPQPQLGMNGEDYGLRLPEFDIEVTTEKASPYKKMEQNELALGFYNQGFFDPMRADQALACLEMMDFSHKEDVMMKIQQNGTIQQLLLQYQQIALQLAQRVGDPMLIEQLSQSVMATAGQTVPPGNVELLGQAEEHPFVEASRNQARESTQAD